MFVKFSELVGQDVSVGHKVKVVLAVLLLHAHHIEAEPVFARDLVTLRKMVDLLVFIEALIEVTFATT